MWSLVPSFCILPIYILNGQHSRGSKSEGVQGEARGVAAIQPHGSDVSRDDMDRVYSSWRVDLSRDLPSQRVMASRRGRPSTSTNTRDACNLSSPPPTISYPHTYHSNTVINKGGGDQGRSHYKVTGSYVSRDDMDRAAPRNPPGRGAPFTVMKAAVRHEWHDPCQEARLPHKYRDRKVSSMSLVNKHTVSRSLCEVPKPYAPQVGRRAIRPQICALIDE
jgi:hypothetical protein